MWRDLQGDLSFPVQIHYSQLQLLYMQLPDLLYRVRLGIAAGLISGVGVEKIDALLATI